MTTATQARKRSAVVTAVTALIAAKPVKRSALLQRPHKCRYLFILDLIGPHNTYYEAGPTGFEAIAPNSGTNILTTSHLAQAAHTVYPLVHTSITDLIQQFAFFLSFSLLFGWQKRNFASFRMAEEELQEIVFTENTEGDNPQPKAKAKGKAKSGPKSTGKDAIAELI